MRMIMIAAIIIVIVRRILIHLTRAKDKKR